MSKYLVVQDLFKIQTEIVNKNNVNQNTTPFNIIRVVKAKTTDEAVCKFLIYTKNEVPDADIRNHAEAFLLSKIEVIK